MRKFLTTLRIFAGTIITIAVVVVIAATEARATEPGARVESKCDGTTKVYVVNQFANKALSGNTWGIITATFTEIAPGASYLVGTIPSSPARTVTLNVQLVIEGIGARATEIALAVQPATGCGTPTTVAATTTTSTVAPTTTTTLVVASTTTVGPTTTTSTTEAPTSTTGAPTTAGNTPTTGTPNTQVTLPRTAAGQVSVSSLLWQCLIAAALVCVGVALYLGYRFAGEKRERQLDPYRRPFEVKS